MRNRERMRNEKRKKQATTIYSVSNTKRLQNSLYLLCVHVLYKLYTIYLYVRWKNETE